MLPNNSFLFAGTGFIRAALLITALLLAPVTAYAVPLYSGSINTNGVIEGVSGSPAPVVLGNYMSIVDTDPGGNSIGLKTTGVDAVANYGRLRGSSFADYLNTRDFFPILSGAAIGNQEASYFSLDDLVISGPPGNILISFNFVLTGGALAIGGGNAQTSSAQAEATMGYQSTSGGVGNLDIGKIGVNNVGSGYAYGIFSTIPMNGNATAMGMTPNIPTFAGDTSLSFSLGLTMSTGAGVGYGAPQGYSYASSSFTLGLPTSGPVANLPEGYTLNSPSGHIVDNQYIAPGPSGDFDFDGDVDGRDFLVWQRGNSPDPLSSGDLTDWQAGYGVGSLVAEGIAVPEPSGASLLTLALLGVFARCKGFSE